MAKLPIPFSNPNTYRGHSGVDYPQRRGTVFRASGPGRVVSRGRNSRGGFFVWVQYDNGPMVGYHHMDSHFGVPAIGARVTEGSQLGFVGSLGQFSTGPHLHSEVSGHATTDGYWKFFDSSRVVGHETPSGGGGTVIKPVPAAAVESEEDDMRHVFVRDDIDGNDVGGWGLLNPSWKPGGPNPKPYLIIRVDEDKAQERANRWAEVHGTARPVSRQAWADAIDAVMKTF